MGLDRHLRFWTPPVRPIVATEEKTREAMQRISVNERALELARRHKQRGDREMAARFAEVAGVPVEEL